METTNPPDLVLPERTGPPSTAPEPDPLLSRVLKYLANDLPGYRFEHRLDVLFVAELLADFPEIDVLEEIKTFRWYYDNQPFSGVKNQRVVIRRWVARAARSRYH